MTLNPSSLSFLTAVAAAVLSLAHPSVAQAPATGGVSTVPGMPPVLDAANLYSETRSSAMSKAVDGALPRVYVPNRGENTVSVIDPATLKVIDKFKVGINPQHVVPSWDMKTLWVANNAEGRTDGSLTPIDPKTGKAGKSVPVDDPTTCIGRPMVSMRLWWPRRTSGSIIATRKR